MDPEWPRENHFEQNEFQHVWKKYDARFGSYSAIQNLCTSWFILVWKYCNEKDLSDFTVKNPHNSYNEVTNIGRIEGRKQGNEVEYDYRLSRSVKFINLLMLFSGYRDL